MAKEAYVSFEVAKLLNEKGFNWRTQYVYTLDGTGSTPHKIGNWRAKSNIQKPTHQMAMKWLREEKDIFIEVEYINPKACGCTIIEQKDGGVIAAWNWDRFQYASKNPLVGNTYENAVIAGIQYVLENLI